MTVDSITQDYVDAHGYDCAHIPLLPRQKFTLLASLLGAFALFLWRWDLFLYAFSLGCAAIYLGIALFRAFAALRTVRSDPTLRVDKRDVEKIKNQDLPIYTILVPLYKEANIADKLIRAINRLDYPAKKLDIKLLLEEDDEETRRAIRRLNLPSQYEVIVVPDALPKTKPKACNYGLKNAKGEFCVIFDAEDRPERDQLKKVVSAFRQLPQEVACLQARLNYFNASQNWLTRWFTIEYTTHFDLLLPGLQRMNLPIPLGGTSNHFRTSVMRELGGWDPFNVTEDCDLGVKVYKAGYQTRMVESTTWEEANSNAWNWIRQRSRWVKGYFQTHFVHMRHPLRTFRSLGLRGYLGFFLGVGGSALMMVLNLFFWTIALVYVGLLAIASFQGASLLDLMVYRPAEKVLPYVTMIGGHEIRAWPLIYYGPGEDYALTLFSLSFFGLVMVLLLTNLLFVATHVAAVLRRGERWLLPHAFTMPFYWVMISFGALKGLIQLFTNPFYWEKTLHGLDDGTFDEEEGSSVAKPAVATVTALLLLFVPSLEAITLAEAEEQALEHNRGIKASQEEVIEARYRRRQTKGQWYPQVSLEGNATRTAAVANRGYATFYSSRLRFAQSVYDPTIYHQIKRRGIELKSSHNDLRGHRNDVLFQVRTAYYDVVVSDKKVEVEKANIDLLEEAAERESGRFEAGDATAFDVNQSKVSTQNARSDFYRVLRESAVARNALLLVLGQDPVGTIDPDESEIPVESIPFLQRQLDRYAAGESLVTDEEIWQWESTTLKTRPEIEQQRLLWLAAQRDERESASQYIPTFGLSATYYNSNVGGNSFGGRNSYWDMVGSFQWTLFDGLAREGRVEEAHHAKGAAWLRYEAAMQEAKAEVRNRFHEIEEALRAFVAARDSVALSQESLQQAGDRRDVGEITPLEYRDATTALTKARRDLYQARYDLLSSYYALRHTSGIDVGAAH